MLSYGAVERNCADQYSLCTLFTVQEADCIRTWAGLAGIATAIDLQAKGDLLVTACGELEHQNILRAALFKKHSTFDDRSCLHFRDWLCDPSNYGTASHGMSHGHCRTLELSTWCHGRLCTPTTIRAIHPKVCLLRISLTHFAEICDFSAMSHASPLLRE